MKNTENRGFCLYVFVLTQNLLTVHGRLNTWPSNAEVVVGSTIRLKCSTSEPYFVEWDHIPFGAKQKQFVYFGDDIIGPYDQRFKVIRDRDTGQYDLEIKNVQLKDAGTYRCTDMEGSGERREAELVVLKSSPNCSCSDRDSEKNALAECHATRQVNVSCGFSYLGNSVPMLVCSEKMKHRGTSIDNSSEAIQHIVSYTYEADGIDSSLNISCRTFISNISSNEFAVNTKSHGAKTVRKTIDHPDFVTCGSSNYTDCRYIWIRVDQNNETAGTDLSYHIAEPGIYRCETECQLNGMRCKVHSMEIEFLKKGLNLMIPLAIGIIASAIVVPSLLVILMLIWRRRSRSNPVIKHMESGPLKTPHPVDQQVLIPVTLMNSDEPNYEKNSTRLLHEFLADSRSSTQISNKARVSSSGDENQTDWSLTQSIDSGIQ